MEIPVCRYRTTKVISNAIIDTHIVESMENFAKEPLVLEFNKNGKVVIALKYLKTWLLQCGKLKKKTVFVNYLFGKVYHHSKFPTVLHLDGNLLNFKLDNLALVFFKTTKLRHKDRPVMWTV